MNSAAKSSQTKILQLFCKYRPASSIDEAQPKFQEQQLQQKSNIELKIVGIIIIIREVLATHSLTHYYWLKFIKNYKITRKVH